MEKDRGPGLDAVIEDSAKSIAGAVEHLGAEILSVVPGYVLAV